SADESSAALAAQVEAIIGGIADLIDVPHASLDRGTAIEVDDRFVGAGYGIPTEESRDAIDLVARSEALFLDPTYSAKAMAALVAAVRQRLFHRDQTVLFWHTGGQVGLFA